MTAPTQIRRFSLGDAMILVLTVAAQLGILKAAEYEWLLSSPREFFSNDTYFTIGAFTLLAPITIAVFAVRLRQPRPNRQDLFGQPGFVACAAGSLAVLLSSIHEGFLGLVCVILPEYFDKPALDSFWYILMIISGSTTWIAGAVIASSWAMLIASNRWTAERSWIDRSGRIVGLAWIVLWPAVDLHNLLK